MIYIHVPFCRSFCSYCGFYSELVPQCVRADLREDGTEAFVDALCREISLRGNEITSQIPTLYIGGGTPSVLPPSALRKILAALEDASHPAPFEEFTLEVNPEDIVERGEGYVRELLDLGVSRISMGVQSFDDRVLRLMNRRHDAAAALKAVDILRGSGVKNLSIDLIFGIGRVCEVKSVAGGGEFSFSDLMWKDTLSKAISIAPEHISAYQLSIEEGSALEKLVSRGNYFEASDDECARQYDLLCSRLAAAGYSHYEISNFARPGFEAVHNSAYWSRVPYAGFGPGAHSLLPEDGSREPFRRRWNAPDLSAYVRGEGESEGGWKSAGESLGDAEILEEKIMLGLRTSSGIPAGLLEDTERGRAALASMLEEGLLEMTKGGRVRIPESRLFVSDNVVSELLARL